MTTGRINQIFGVCAARADSPSPPRCPYDTAYMRRCTASRTETERTDGHGPTVDTIDAAESDRCLSSALVDGERPARLEAHGRCRASRPHRTTTTTSYSDRALESKQ